MRVFALATFVSIVACTGGRSVDGADASTPAVATPAGLARTLAKPLPDVDRVLTRRLAMSTSGETRPLAAGDLALHVASAANLPTRVGTDDDHALAFSLIGASSTPLEVDDGVAVHRDALPSIDALWSTTEARAELIFVLRDEKAVPHVRIRVERGAGLAKVERGGDAITFLDVRGHRRLQIPTPMAVDANGTKREAVMTLEDDGVLDIALDDAGLVHPILLDPAVLQARWTVIGERFKRTMASLSWDPTRAKLIAYGGYQGGSYDEPGVGATLLYAYSFPARSFDGLASGPSGFTSAMLAASPPYHDFGYFGAFDTARGKLVAIGNSDYDCTSGCTTNNKMSVQEWDSATDTWAAVCVGACSASAPPATQTGVEVVYDANRKLTLVCRSDRTCWSWNGATAKWATIASIPAAYTFRGYYDPTYGAVTFLASDGTYSYNGTGWVKRTASTVGALSATYDTIRKRAIAIVGNGTYTDTYEWDGAGSWTLILSATTSSPFNKPYVAMGFDPVNGRAVAWGGGTGQTSYYAFDFIGTVFEYQAFGNSCAGDVDCLGGSCRDGFCCDSKCGACRRCDGPGAGGVCAPFAGVASGTEHDTCTGTNACDPSGNCRKKNGQACTSGTDCVSGACVDGYCCATACNQACEVCSATPGTCTPAPKGSSGRGTCGAGACNGTLRVCTTACTTDADCSASGWCKAGTCVATLVDGTACGRDRQCTSGACRDGVCCNGSCDGPCETCAKAKGASADGTCTPQPASAKPIACGGYACSGTSGACATSCATDGECAAGYFCDGSFCQRARSKGDGCARTSQCAAGLTCADGVCCNSACDGACQACSAANKASGDAPGECGPAKAGSDPGDRCPAEDPSTCGKSGVCGKSGTCALYAKGAACGGGVACESGVAKGRTCDGLGACVTDTVGTACAPGTCSASAGCSFACTKDDDCDATGWCDGDTCKPRSKPGSTCTADAQCASGFCVDGVCCTTACTGVCEACNGAGTEGTCTAVAGPPRAGHGSCGGKSGDDACTAAACDGDARDACKAFAGPEVSCRVASCVDGVESLATKCDGTGVCPKAETRACAPFGCGKTKCNSSCTTDDDCAKGNRCDVGTGLCVSIGTCDGDHTISGADGTTTDCSPYRCTDKGCASTCESSDQCVAPTVCASGRCVPPPESDSGGSCALSHRDARAVSGMLFLFVALAGVLRRKGAL